MSPGQGRRAQLVGPTRTWTAGGWGSRTLGGEAWLDGLLRAGAQGRSLLGRCHDHSQRVRGSPLGWPVPPALCTVTPCWAHRAIQQGHLSLGRGETRWGWEKDLEATRGLL